MQIYNIEMKTSTKNRCLWYLTRTKTRKIGLNLGRVVATWVLGGDRKHNGKHHAYKSKKKLRLNNTKYAEL